jgi:hypothetical protein
MKMKSDRLMNSLNMITSMQTPVTILQLSRLWVWGKCRIRNSGKEIPASTCGSACNSNRISLSSHHRANCAIVRTFLVNFSCCPHCILWVWTQKSSTELEAAVVTWCFGVRHTCGAKRNKRGREEAPHSDRHGALVLLSHTEMKKE